jgi:membrane protein DedA with SNARE-associated domain
MVLALALHLHVHHHFHGPPLDYTAVGIGAFASWLGVPGPGEPLLIAAGVLAAQHRLDITEVVLVAWIGATVGGIGGWIIGMRAGRALLEFPGPLHGARLRALARGERLFNRHPRTAVLFAPTWVAGIHRVRASIYLPWNAVGAFLWAAGIGIGAYLIGPAIVDIVGDIGLIPEIALGLIILGAVWLELTRRRGSG